MQKALESIFGPELLGIFSLVMMIIMIGPKVVNWWRGFRNRQIGPLDGRARITKQRFIHVPTSPNVQTIPDHPDHGKPITRFNSNLRNLLIEASLWIFPFPLAFLFIPEGQHSLRLMCIIISLLMITIGISVLIHIGDRVVFYETGIVLKLRFKQHSVDYNSICRITKRKSMFFWMSPSYILHLDDGTLFVLDGSYFKDGADLRTHFLSLDPRVKHNTSLIQPEKEKASAPIEDSPQNAAVERSEKS